MGACATSRKRPLLVTSAWALVNTTQGVSQSRSSRSVMPDWPSKSLTTRTRFAPKTALVDAFSHWPEMADSEFEEFRQYFDQLPQHIRAPARCYTLVHDITPCEDVPDFEGMLSSCISEAPFGGRESTIAEESSTYNGPEVVVAHPSRENGQESPVDIKKPPERRRRKLPEIPKNCPKFDIRRIPTLADELSQLEFNSDSKPLTLEHRQHPLFRPHIRYRVDEEPQCESDVWPGTDVDSGRDSTAHSPEESKASSPHNVLADTTPSTPSTDLLLIPDNVEPTHRGLHKFKSRHSDEIDIDIGDPVYVQQEAEDSWCEGINLRTRLRGIFPSAYVVDVDYDFDPDGRRVNKERYVLDFLGSIETVAHKGEQVLCAAVERARTMSVPNPQTCILEISDHGLHVTDKSKSTSDQDHFPCHDYFFALKNVTFCGFHPTEQQYVGFITKHPTEERFACHVFQGNGSTRHVAEAIGRAFQRFCRKFIELAYPIHEFYME